MGEIKLYIKNNYQRLLVSSVVFMVFYFISSRTPLSGDDWAFSNNVVKSGIVDAAVGMYFHWEGRLMTLFSMHALIQYKWLWNLLNAFMYANIFYLLSSFIKKENQLLSLMFLFFFVFSIKDNIRMETYTWITGSIYYGIPLWMSVIFVHTIYNILFNFKENFLSYLLIAFTSFYLPLGMENISIAVGLVILGLIIYEWFKHKKIHKILWISLFFYSLAFIIWFLSPGSSIRLATMPEWQSLSLIDKIIRNLPQIINFAFIQNKMIILSISLMMIYLTYKKFSRSTFVISSIIYGLGIVFLLNARIVQFLPALESLFDINQWWSILFWVSYILLMLYQMITYSIKHMNNILLIIFMSLATFSSASLLMSPVIGYRLMLYTVYYLFISFILIFDTFKLNALIKKSMIVLLMILIFLDLRTYYIKYSAVNAIYQERNLILEDYQQYSDQYTSGIWLPRYPIYTIHAGDIEIDDSYHMEAFKIYFDIPLNTDVIFYWKESY